MICRSERCGILLHLLESPNEIYQEIAESGVVSAVRQAANAANFE